MPIPGDQARLPPPPPKLLGHHRNVTRRDGTRSKQKAKELGFIGGDFALALSRPCAVLQPPTTLQLPDQEMQGAGLAPAMGTSGKPRLVPLGVSLAVSRLA